MQARGRSLTFQPGEILNNTLSIPTFFFLSFLHILGLPAVRIVGECLLTATAPTPSPPGPTLHGQRTDSVAEGAATRLGCRLHVCESASL